MQIFTYKFILYNFVVLATSKVLSSHPPIPVPPGYHEHQRPLFLRPATTRGGCIANSSRLGSRGGSREGGERKGGGGGGEGGIKHSPSRPMTPREQFGQMGLQEEWRKRVNGAPSDKDEEVHND